MLFLFSSAASVTYADNSLYQAKCASCHSGDGTGNKKLGMLTGGDLSRLDLTKTDTSKKTDDELKNIVLNGKNKMPSFKGKLSEEEITRLVKFLRALQKK
ncbi:MAG: hypothetical protein A3G49_03725 [Candidatus Sungbacteria bacterium RIFCSPLOWO2_12_FULL_41_11]|uniref:Cytochrome c domain-containing protein n=1 Tax=Candidatus Sungbacteria bacterium RIFCSPLOWO2_12_FULL_41_11 TaxID=1802286 RepID=A0A1G2LPR1_9BACT|nr:MAG: hypothetical protein A3D41_03390 [Candidatus Sungbacteria bacterium RIFCSPHIGHO2_02_FULL_41_12b]OHA12869.1 MAG: hypothetical protein A3G49_03725 [Candidatus Sungbacteria bacterium RIFCSPLOWO2_12_FULL_41_11]